MSRIHRGYAVAVALLVAVAGLALADVVVLKGGTVVPLKQPVVRRGNTAYLTRADGTLLSVPVTEIDREATAAANQAAAAAAAAPAPAEAPASTPAEAARATADTSGPKAKVRITDADVSHPMDLGTPEEAKGEAAPAGAPGSARVEVADYTQELRGDALTVKGTLRNPTQTPAEGVRMTVAAIDEKGEPIDSAGASLSKGSIASGQTVEFTTTINVGQKTVATLRFNSAVGGPEAAAAHAPSRFGGSGLWRRGGRPGAPTHPLRSRRPLRGSRGECALPGRPPTARPATSPGPRARTTSPSRPAARAVRFQRSGIRVRCGRALRFTRGVGAATLFSSS